ncbi:hypothetical protein [uncultured Campylobacter sp.]|nr:hypothetical protein [uncultured Campylobacter sp.]
MVAAGMQDFNSAAAHNLAREDARYGITHSKFRGRVNFKFHG